METEQAAFARVWRRVAPGADCPVALSPTVPAPQQPEPGRTCGRSCPPLWAALLLLLLTQSAM